MRISEDKSSIFRLYLWCAFCGFVFASTLHFASIAVSDLAPPPEIWKQLHFSFVSLCHSLSISPALIPLSLQLISLFRSSAFFFYPPDVPAQLTHMSSQAEHTCVPRSLAVCVGVSVNIWVCTCVCVCVFCPAVRSDTTTKLDQFVKSREVWASRTNLLLLLKVNRGVWIGLLIQIYTLCIYSIYVYTSVYMDLNMYVYTLFN